MSRERKHDIILIVGLLILIAFAWLVIRYWQDNKEPGSFVVVYVDGKEFGRYPLSKDDVIIIPTGNGEKNKLEITKGGAKMVSASCRDKICVHHREIRKTGESIVCLPHKIVVKIEGGQDQEVDITTN